MRHHRLLYSIYRMCTMYQILPRFLILQLISSKIEPLALRIFDSSFLAMLLRILFPSYRQSHLQLNHFMTPYLIVNLPTRHQFGQINHSKFAYQYLWSSRGFYPQRHQHHNIWHQKWRPWSCRKDQE